MASASPTLITPKFLFDYPLSPNVNDYRCVVNALGTEVIFERSVGSGPSQLYLLNLSEADPTPFIEDPKITISSRPDWSWVKPWDVAFNFLDTDIRVGVVDSSGGAFKSGGSKTDKMNYPTWFPDGKTVAVENYTASAQPNGGASYPLPNTTTIDATSGVVLLSDLEGLYLWAGMPSVNPVNPNLIAFAGQPILGSTYNQDTNYIYVMDTSSSDSPMLLEPAALSAGPFVPKYQGRAPWWSPDGKWVVFESNRGCQPSPTYQDGMYAIYLCEYGATTPAFVITDWAYNCNHAKWFPNGFSGGPAVPFQLIVAAWQNGGATTPSGPYGLSVLDLTPLGITF